MQNSNYNTSQRRLKMAEPQGNFQVANLENKYLKVSFIATHYTSGYSSVSTHRTEGNGFKFFLSLTFFCPEGAVVLVFSIAFTCSDSLPTNTMKFILPLQYLSIRLPRMKEICCRDMMLLQSFSNANFWHSEHQTAKADVSEPQPIKHDLIWQNALCCVLT